jgi:hypothetical protein
MTRWLLALVAAVGALVALSAAAEAAWLAGYPVLADLVAVARLVACWLWLLPAWKVLRAAPHPGWGHAGRTALAAVLVFAVLT